MASWPPPQPARRRAPISHVPYLPGLDGLRALAVVGVMIYHANAGWLSGGFLGVEVFFVVSGYLITLLIIAEHERTNRVRLKDFWLRRARRLLPALFVMLAALALYLAFFDPRPQGQTRGDFLGGVFYGSNWYQIVVGQGYTAADAFAPLRHLWSLAVEEQFYLIWPIVMVVLLRKGRDRLPKVALKLFAASAGLALVTGLLFVNGDVAVQCAPGMMHGYWDVFGRCISVNDTLYLSTITRAGGLMLGAGFAMFWRPMALLRGPMRRKGHLLDLFAFLGVIALGAMMWKLSLSGSGSEFGVRFNPWLFRGGLFATGLATVVIIAAVVHRGAVMGKLLGNPVFRWVGTRSYGLYLFHWPIYEIIRKSAGAALSVKQLLLAMAITLPITELSYRFIETPVRRGQLSEALRRQPRRSARRHQRRLVLVAATVAMALGFASVSIAVADNECVGALECSLQQPGLVAVSAAPTVTAATSPTTTSTTTTTTTVATTAVATTTSTATAGSVLITPIGGSAPQATTSPASAPTVTTSPPVPTTTAPATTAPPPTAPPANGGLAPVALGESVMLGARPILNAGGITVDAEVSRQGRQMVALVQAMRAANQLGQTVIIQIGTNGSVSSADFAAIMAQLPADLTPQVVFLTVRAPKKWIDANNAIIRSLPAQYKNVSVLDWAVASNGTKLCSDGIHVVCGGGAAQFYSNLIFDAIGRPDLKK